MKTKDVLQELFDLLEAYAPAWYTEEQRGRAAAALDYPENPGLHLIKPLDGNEADSVSPADSAPSRERPAAAARKLAKRETGAYVQ